MEVHAQAIQSVDDKQRALATSSIDDKQRRLRQRMAPGLHADPTLGPLDSLAVERVLDQTIEKCAKNMGLAAGT